MKKLLVVALVCVFCFMTVMSGVSITLVAAEETEPRLARLSPDAILWGNWSTVAKNGYVQNTTGVLLENYTYKNYMEFFFNTTSDILTGWDTICGIDLSRGSFLAPAVGTTVQLKWEWVDAIVDGQAKRSFVTVIYWDVGESQICCGVDTLSPSISLSFPQTESLITYQEVITIQGKVTDNIWVAKLDVNGVNVELKNDGSFVTDVILAKGDNLIKIAAEDMAGNKSEKNLLIAYERLLTIDASAGSKGGSISPSGQITVKHGDSQTFTITPNNGYKIVDVKVDGTSVGAISTYTFTDIAIDHTIQVWFEMNAYTLTILSSKGGSISPSGQITVKHGDSQTFTITPNNGYKIVDVKVDGTSVGAISTYTFTSIGSNHKIEGRFEKIQTQAIVILHVGSPIFTVNGVSRPLDSPPVIKNGRTLVPIRAIIESLGGAVGWDGTSRKVTVTLGGNTIELWIGKNVAKVNGKSVSIDSLNIKVVPEIINDRTMLPLRFVSENIGCSVLWTDATKTITITYNSSK